MAREVEFEEAALVVRSYPFPWASFQPGERLPRQRLRAWTPGFPPQIYYDGPRGMEVVFVPATQKDELAQWGLPERSVPDVWSLLLDPFLDTEHSREWQEGVARQLRQAGISDSEAQEWRERVGPHVLRYNSIVWEWVHLGHWDWLQALRHSLLSPGAREAEYWRSMQLLERLLG